MRLFGFFRRNKRWERQVDAHIDGRLSPVERALLNERLEESETVRRTLQESLTLKRALRAMPEYPAPRSFAIIETMLGGAASAPSPPPRGARVTMRLSQATAFVAVAAFGVLATIDLTGTGDDSTTAATGDTALAATATDDASKAGDGAVAPEIAPQPTAVADETEDGQRNADPAGMFDQASPDAGMTAIGLTTEESSGRDYLPLYGALGGVLALAVAAWAVSRRQLSRATARF